MKKLIVIIATFYSAFAYGQATIQRSVNSNILPGCGIGGSINLEDDPSFQYATKKEWKLDQMYVNQTAQHDTLIANVSMILNLENIGAPNFLWVKKIGNDKVAKDYPLEFVPRTTNGKCTLYQFNLYHKYNNNLLYTYTIMHVSEAALVFTTAQQDAENPTVYHTIEYRFVPKRN